jgi:hypothetical protein
VIIINILKTFSINDRIKRLVYEIYEELIKNAWAKKEASKHVFLSQFAETVDSQKKMYIEYRRNPE